MQFLVKYLLCKLLQWPILHLLVMFDIKEKKHLVSHFLLILLYNLSNTQRHLRLKECITNSRSCLVHKIFRIFF